MITSFGSRLTEDVFHGRSSNRTRRLSRDVIRVAVRKLDMIKGASEVSDLRVPPGNRLEALRGDLTGFHSIRVHSRWRIVFRWQSGDAGDVEIVDYH